ncbi:hypothetical protein QA641_22905 [Bradyrhizobium sp. CB1650]|uniref:hypothetical protein n=1 Tax=Bradyrhizobium sp. CB1650 TaxID=3039153 RepID=UPI002435DB35|nr:hypothetical protein [Bradyrhizobium sp. CB1650]WGD48510.1 hypothetical protein QA641_22905 [Bradyrhizobium sp. CB1650]
MSRWPKLMLMGGITSALLVYEITSATEAPSQALVILQYVLPGCAPIGPLGSIVMYVQER